MVNCLMTPKDPACKAKSKRTRTTKPKAPKAGGVQYDMCLKPKDKREKMYKKEAIKRQRAEMCPAGKFPRCIKGTDRAYCVRTRPKKTAPKKAAKKTTAAPKKAAKKTTAAPKLLK